MPSDRSASVEYLEVQVEEVKSELDLPQVSECSDFPDEQVNQEF